MHDLAQTHPYRHKNFEEDEEEPGSLRDEGGREEVRKRREGGRVM